MFLFSKNSVRLEKRSVKEGLIDTFKMVSDLMKTALGPQGSCKLIINNLQEFMITSRGTIMLNGILSEDAIVNNIIKKTAKTQNQEVGDGVKTTIILVGELLTNAEKLLGNIHPNPIVNGYRLATIKAEEVLEKIALTRFSDDFLKKVALTTLNSRLLVDVKEFFADMIVKAVKQVCEVRDGQKHIDLNHIRIVKKEGRSFLDSEYIDGVVLRGLGMKYLYLYPSMQRKVKNAKIALLNQGFEVSLGEKIKSKMFGNIVIRNDPNKVSLFLEKEIDMLNENLRKLSSLGVNVVFCMKGIDEYALHWMAEKGFLMARRIKDEDMEALIKATGGKLVNSVDELTPACLGEAKEVEVKRYDGEEMLFVRGCKNPKCITILIRGSYLDEAEQCIKSALKNVSQVLKNGKILPGGGAAEVEVAEQLRVFAKNIGGYEKLAVEAYASAVEAVAKILAGNAGLDPLEVLTNLRKRHAEGERWVGIEAIKGKLDNMMSNGVIEPLNVKRYILKTACEVVALILRIDTTMYRRMEFERKVKKPAEKPREEGIPMILEKTEERY